jgi:hypothetical protein
LEETAKEAQELRVGVSLQEAEAIDDWLADHVDRALKVTMAQGASDRELLDQLKSPEVNEAVRQMRRQAIQELANWRLTERMLKRV